MKGAVTLLPNITGTTPVNSALATSASVTAIFSITISIVVIGLEVKMHRGNQHGMHIMPTSLQRVLPCSTSHDNFGRTRKDLVEKIISQLRLQGRIT
jgi:hypothetical protein